MGLEDTFGEDFVQNYKQTIAERREERNSVSDEQLREIAHKAVNENAFDDGEPQFQYVTENDVTHDVYLMQLPEMEGRSIFSYTNELDSGAVTCPLDYLDDWWSCLFNDPEDLKQMNPGEHYIIIGQYDTWTNDKGEEKEQISPVRGVLTLDEAKEMADAYLQGEVSDGTTEDTSEEEEEEDTSDDDGGVFGDAEEDDEDEEEEEEDSSVEYEDVQDIVQSLADQDEAVWEVSQGDDRLEKLAKVICKRMELDASENAEEVAQHALDAIDEHNSDDDDEEEGSLF